MTKTIKIKIVAIVILVACAAGIWFWCYKNTSHEFMGTMTSIVGSDFSLQEGVISLEGKYINSEETSLSDSFDTKVGVKFNKNTKFYREVVLLTNPKERDLTSKELPQPNISRVTGEVAGSQLNSDFHNLKQQGWLIRAIASSNIYDHQEFLADEIRYSITIIQ